MSLRSSPSSPPRQSSARKQRWSTSSLGTERPEITWRSAKRCALLSCQCWFVALAVPGSYISSHPNSAKCSAKTVQTRSPGCCERSHRSCLLGPSGSCYWAQREAPARWCQRHSGSNCYNRRHRSASSSSPHGRTGVSKHWREPGVHHWCSPCSSPGWDCGPSFAPQDSKRQSMRATVRRDLWSFAGPRGLAGTLQVSLDRVAILLVGALASSAAAGQWAAISRLVGVAQRSFHAVGQALNPRLSSLALRNDWSGAARVFEQITIATIAVLMPAVLGLAVFPKAALDIFGGPEFEDPSTALTIAAIATIAATLLAHVDNVLLMAGRSVTALLDTSAALASTILLTIVLVPRYELNGAALAMAAGIVVYRGTAAVQIARSYDVSALHAPDTDDCDTRHRDRWRGVATRSDHRRRPPCRGRRFGSRCCRRVRDRRSPSRAFAGTRASFRHRSLNMHRRGAHSYASASG